ncbi:prolyl-tRNA synthetase, putative [Leishmania tarentolae]|uniref:Prolyl-tRNA synthetase, putative n=1 Tax=Leishmania tarentolae TaxID=5689 RepID=A0A640KDS1_LEITA|nr:prolyl-tRNA synthetase, putative [Leishmania tarentolae]
MYHAEKFSSRFTAMPSFVSPDCAVAGAPAAAPRFAEAASEDTFFGFGAGAAGAGAAEPPVTAASAEGAPKSTSLYVYPIFSRNRSSCSKIMRELLSLRQGCSANGMGLSFRFLSSNTMMLCCLILLMSANGVTHPCTTASVSLRISPGAKRRFLTPAAFSIARMSVFVVCTAVSSTSSPFLLFRNMFLVPIQGVPNRPSSLFASSTVCISPWEMVGRSMLSSFNTASSSGSPLQSFADMAIVLPISIGDRDDVDDGGGGKAFVLRQKKVVLKSARCDNGTASPFSTPVVAQDDLSALDAVRTDPIVEGGIPHERQAAAAAQVGGTSRGNRVR